MSHLLCLHPELRFGRNKDIRRGQDLETRRAIYGWQRNFGMQRLIILAVKSIMCSIWHTEKVLETFLLLSEPVADCCGEPKPSLKLLGTSV